MNKITFYYIFVLLFFFNNLQLHAQYTMGNTGLLHAPTAEMQKDGTFLLGGNYLNHHNMPSGWTYNTYNYYIDITFLPFIEIAYTCHLLSFGEWGHNGHRFNNQDRSFSGRIRIIKEKQFYKYVPAIVIGTYDPVSGHSGGGSAIIDQSGDSHNYFARYYIVGTKHFENKTIGILGFHVGYIYSRGTGFKYKGTAIGVNFSPSFQQNLNLIAEYDARTFNCGFQYDLFNHCICTVELQKFKYISAGICFKIFLKKDKNQ